MDDMKLAVLGAGNVQCIIPVVVSLASYFGERPLEIRLYDADPERLDLFDSFARIACFTNKNKHTIRAGEDPLEMLQDVDRVILQVDENCARKEALASGHPVKADPDERIAATLSRILADFHSNAQVMNLQRSSTRIPLDYYYRLNWPPQIDEAEQQGVPHQVLRWIRGEEYLYEMFKLYEKSPLKEWLDDVGTASVVTEG
jgi:hypothetical protein